jgi:hypothetical protein
MAAASDWRNKMKRGLILYLTEGSEKLPDWLDMERYSKDLDVNTVCLAASEADVHHYWWQLVARGMHHISCVCADYDETQKAIHLKGSPLRFFG